MNVSKNNKELFDKYLETRDISLIEEILNNSFFIVEKAIKIALKSKGLPQSEYEEYIGIAYIELYNKLISMDNYKGDAHNFYRFLKMCVVASIVSYISKEKKRLDKMVSLDYIADDFTELEREGLVDWSLEEIDKKMVLDYFNNSVLSSAVTVKQSEYIRLYYGLDGLEPLNLDQIAKLYGVSHASVQCVIASGMRNIRRYLANRKLILEIKEDAKNNKRRK